MLKLSQPTRWAAVLLLVLSAVGHLAWYLNETGSGRTYDLTMALRVQIALWCACIALGYLWDLVVLSARYQRLGPDDELMESVLAQALIYLSWWGLAVTVTIFYTRAWLAGA